MWRHPYHLHPLDVADPAVVHRQSNGEWFCDRCQPAGWSGQSPVGRMWRCTSGCDYDLCDRCVQHATIQCSSHVHPLLEADPTVVHRQHGGKWFCDGCGIGRRVLQCSSPTGKMWRCTCGCDFDLCDRCCVPSENGAHGSGPHGGGTGTGDGDASGNGMECIICLSAARTTAFLPCGHFVACGTCAAGVMLRVPKTCPVCRQEPTSLQAIFT